MRFARLGPIGAEMPVLVTEDGRCLDLTVVTDDIDGRFFASGGADTARQAYGSGRLPVLADAETMRIGSPIARPGAIVCVGMNYAAHAAESGARPPTEPVIFLKAPNTVTGPDDDIRIPPGSVKTDWEVELGVVIGRTATYLESPRHSAQHVAGFVVANDLSERKYQLEDSGGQWSKGKCCPGFSPVGPWLVTPDEVDPAALRLRSFVNGQPRQDSSTADMIFDVAFLIYHLSQYLTLDPGDLILTGTPQGVALSGRFPYLQPGDLVEVEIDELGRQRQHMLAPDPVDNACLQGER
jgi:2,4-didehydro-3-deoxy-L-rhamnonate hydrolase